MFDVADLKDIEEIGNEALEVYKACVQLNADARSGQESDSHVYDLKEAVADLNRKYLMMFSS